MVLRYLLTSRASAVREEESRFSFCPLRFIFREYKQLLSLDSHTRVHMLLTCTKKYSGYGSETHILQLFSTFHELKEAILFYIVFLQLH